MKQFIALILCISGAVPTGNMATIARVARSHGYQVSRLNNRETAMVQYAFAPDRCAVVVSPSTADMVGVYFLYYNKSEVMTTSRADNLLKRWETWF